MGRGVTLKGAAAAAFINGQMGKAPETDDEKYMRIATYVHMEMASKTKEWEKKAKRIVECLTKEGIDRTLAIIEGR